MGQINSAPCLKCSDRKIGCHGVCVDYIEFQKKTKAIKKIKRNRKNKKGQQHLDQNILNKNHISNKIIVDKQIK